MYMYMHMPFSQVYARVYTYGILTGRGPAEGRLAHAAKPHNHQSHTSHRCWLRAQQAQVVTQRLSVGALREWRRGEHVVRQVELERGEGTGYREGGDGGRHPPRELELAANWQEGELIGGEVHLGGALGLGVRVGVRVRG